MAQSPDTWNFIMSLYGDAHMLQALWHGMKIYLM